MCDQICGWAIDRRAFGLMALGFVALPAMQPRAAEGGLTIVPRAAWGAKPASPGLIPHEVQAIIVHHTAVAIQQVVPLVRKMKGLQNFSQVPGRISNGRAKPAWADVPYHFYIDCNGAIAEGRDLAMKGDTNTNYDTAGYAQIVVEGNFQVEEPRAAQLAALKALMIHLRDERLKRPLPVFVHKDKAGTTCPGQALTAAVRAMVI